MNTLAPTALIFGFFEWYQILGIIILVAIIFFYKKYKSKNM